MWAKMQVSEGTDIYCVGLMDLIPCCIALDCEQPNAESPYFIGLNNLIPCFFARDSEQPNAESPLFLTL